MIPYSSFLRKIPARRFLRPSPLVFLSVLCAGNLFAQESPAPVPAPVIRHPQIGVCTHFGLDWWDANTVLPLVAKSGAAWIRDEIYWDKIEQKKGVYQIPEKTLRWINAANAAGLKVLLIFNGSNPLYKPDIYNADAYAEAAAFVAKELAGKVQALEVLNEPANFGYSKHYGGTWNGMEKGGSLSPWVGKYVALLNKAAKAVKTANPGIKVIGLGSVAPANFRQLAMKVDSRVDGITEHPYSYQTQPEIQGFNAGMLERDGIVVADDKGTFASLIKNYRQQSAKYAGPKEIWLTEWGWSTFIEHKPQQYAGFTRSAQAKYILRRLAESLGLGIAVSVIYDFKDDGKVPFEVEQNFGLVDHALNPKPSYDAVQRFATLMADYKPKQNFNVKISAPVTNLSIHPISDGEKTNKNIACHQFADSKGRPLIALWSTERAGGDTNPPVATVEIAANLPGARVKAHELLTGRSFDVPAEVQGNKIILKHLAIPDAPLALTFE